MATVKEMIQPILVHKEKTEHQILMDFATPEERDQFESFLLFTKQNIIQKYAKGFDLTIESKSSGMGLHNPLRIILHDFNRP